VTVRTYQVDQSGKIESHGSTILTLSNDKEYTIRIPAREKRAAMAYLTHRGGGSRKLNRLRLFAVALYYLLQELPPGERVTIDVEYTGHEQDIRSMLLNLLWKDNPRFDPGNIIFGYVGKKSPAHQKALAVYRGKAKAHIILKADDLLKPIIG
jgi:hypothetical protein